MFDAKEIVTVAGPVANGISPDGEVEMSETDLDSVAGGLTNQTGGIPKITDIIDGTSNTILIGETQHNNNHTGNGHHHSCP